MEQDSGKAWTVKYPYSPIGWAIIWVFLGTFLVLLPARAHDWRSRDLEIRFLVLALIFAMAPLLLRLCTVGVRIVPEGLVLRTGLGNRVIPRADLLSAQGMGRPPQVVSVRARRFILPIQVNQRALGAADGEILTAILELIDREAAGPTSTASPSPR